MTVAKPTRTLIVENGDFSPATIDPDSFGLMADVPETEWTAELHWQTADAVLRGESHLAYLLNSGLRLWVTKHAESLEEGISKARTAQKARSLSATLSGAGLFRQQILAGSR
ncbi:hypothetical protein [Brevibacillus centrosporus]|uniref:hypothetical protein n=1 Tax=Brevibacillus centrosporus TaxID=54910 RepID=UPI003986A95E